MSDYEGNITLGYNYSDYYGYMPDDTTFTPCNSVSVRDFGQVFLPTLYSLVFILGFIGNGLVVCVLVKHRRQTNLTDICLFNLAVSDLLFVFTLPFFSHYAVVSEWTFGDFMCRFAAVSHSTGFFSSIFFMVAMTLDRYIVIMHAVKAGHYRTLRAGIALTLLVWVLSLIVSIPAFVFTKVTNQSQLMSCQYDPINDGWKLYDLLATNLLGLVIPFLVMAVCYSGIIPRLVNLKSTKRHRIVKLIISIMVVFFLFWAPYNICLVLRFLKPGGDNCTQDSNLKLAITVTEAFAYTHCCLNPIIYAFVGQKFMKRALQLLKTCVPGIHSGRDLSDSSYRKSSVVSRSSDVTSIVMR